jgi:multisubunit Na+/H+ antiporter MnhC subunit
VHDGVTRILSAAMIVLGVLLMTRGAVLALVLGLAMIGAGAGRLWVVAQQRRPPR